MHLSLDNSAISLIHCKRKFQLTVIEGKRTIANEIANTGNALHVMLELLDKGSSVDNAITTIRERYPDVDHSKVISTITLYKTITKLPPPIILSNGDPAIEVKFRTPYCTVETPDGPVTIDLVGTIDRIHLDKDTLVFLDYKSGVASTDYQITKSMADYDLSFQLPFYVHAAKISGILPAVYKDCLNEHNYRTELHFLYYNNKPPVFKKKVQPAFNSDFLDREVPYVIDAKIREAITVAQLNIPAPRDGMNVYKACSYCAFKPACLSMGTDREESFLAQFEVKPYDPLSFR